MWIQGASWDRSGDAVGFLERYVSTHSAFRPCLLLLVTLSTGAQEQYQQPWSKCQWWLSLFCLNFTTFSSL